MDMRVREWEKLNYLDSERILRELHKIATENDLSVLPYEVRALRRRDLRPYGEGRQAALFCYLMSKVAGVPVSFAQAEAHDYDVVARYVRGGVASYVPVQLKELVPDRVQANADLQIELNKIAKYVDSQDLVVAFHLNVGRRVEFASLKFPVGMVGELWFFGASSPDQMRWALIGDMLRDERHVYEFDHPCA